MAERTICVEVAYAEPQHQYVWQGEVAEGTTARQAVLLSDVVQHFPHIDVRALPIGICGKKTADDAVLQDWDRVELYRPLLVDPKENRRRRAEKKTQAA